MVERGEYEAKEFLEELKEMVRQVVFNVKSENRIVNAAKPVEMDTIVGTICPECGKGTLLKGNSAYGCSRWKEGCSFRKPF
jgi:DNA topoisomerase-3